MRSNYTLTVTYTNPRDGSFYSKTIGPFSTAKAADMAVLKVIDKRNVIGVEVVKASK